METHRTAQSALSLAFMIKNVFKITRIAAKVSFYGYQWLQLKYAVEDRLFSNIEIVNGLINDNDGFYIHVGMLYKSPI